MSKTGADLPLVVAASHLVNASMKGYLEKKRPSKKLLSIKYQRRWCLVYGNLFLYYDSPEDKAQKGGFSLESYRFLHSPGHSPFGFSLVSQLKRKFEFMAPSKDEYINWENAIKKGIALTRRQNEPLKVKPMQTTKDDQDLYKKHANLEKISTMPNMKIPERPRIPPNTYVSPKSIGAKTFPEKTKAQTNNITNSPKILERKAMAMQEASKYDLYIKGNKTSGSESDSDSDGDDGYIKTAKLNLPKIPIKHTENTPIDDTKDYTQDDYMIVLPSLPPDKSVKVESPYVEFKSDETDSQVDGKIEKIYSSVKNPSIGLIKQMSESDYAIVDHTLRKDDDSNAVNTRNPSIGFIQQRSESDYASVDHSVLNNKDDVVKGSRNPQIGGIKQRSESDYASVDSVTLLRKNPPCRKAEQSSNSGYVTVDHYGAVNNPDSDEADSDDDYENPHTVIDYTSLPNLHLPQNKVQSVSSSSTESESDDSEDDYMKPGSPLKPITNNNQQVNDISYLSSESSDTDDQLSDPASVPITVQKVFDPIYENFA
ncbi:uncharacterized protein LOC134708180 [Mytilus trossulus]|uniref:uncharacterized protein LOC134708180 n=1 Tax=Mytilus trossulus TaxID=6551 RepID=UPI0030050E11